MKTFTLVFFQHVINVTTAYTDSSTPNIQLVLGSGRRATSQKSFLTSVAACKHTVDGDHCPHTPPT